MGNPTIKAKREYLYQNLTDNIRTIIAMAGDGTGAMSLTNDVVYWDAFGNVQQIFTPSAGATTPYMALTRDYAFFTDGVAADLKMWNIDGTVTNWGIAAPTTAPSLSVVSGKAGSWSANTVVTTFGLLIDSNNNVQQLVSVNADGTNPNGITGASGVGSPAWNQTPGGTTSDTNVTWTNRGPIGLWQANHFYSEGHYGHGTIANPSIIYDPGTNALYFNNKGGGGTSGGTYPPFRTGAGVITNDGQARWHFLGFVDPKVTGAVGGWKPSTFYPSWGGSTNFAPDAVVEPVDVITAYDPFTNGFNQTVYVQSSSGGTTPASESHPAWATHPGEFTNDKQLRWVNLGPKAWPSVTAVTAWAQDSTSFTVIEDTTSTMEVCIVSGTTAGTHPTWPTPYIDGTYGTVTLEGTGVTWTDVGPPMTWAASTLWYLPPGGFVPPASSSQYGGVTIIDSNNELQSVTTSGKTGGTAPAWAGTGNYTTDSGAHWFAIEPAGNNLGDITLTKGRYYFVAYQNDTTGVISDVSPISSITGPITGGGVLLFNIPVSPDPQVSSKLILTTNDGGDPTILYYIATIANATTSYSDNVSAGDVLLSPIYQETDANGNEIGLYNNQPPPNGSFPTLHKGRIFLLKGPLLYWSKSLADVTTSSGIIAGRPEAAFDPNAALDFSPGAEKGTGMLSDGYSLYIGTERHVRRLIGDQPSNFQLPNTIFSEAGVMNQDVWKIVFLRGQPIGCMWITPDFRVIESDFNVYNNIGEEIQTTLNSINPAALPACWATFVGYGTYAFYVLAIPTGSHTVADTACIFDLQRRKWYVWTCADNWLSGLYYVSLMGVPRWVMFSNDGTIRYMDPTSVMDRAGDADAAGISSTWQTSWLQLGDPGLHKILNEIEVGTSVPDMTVAVEGATTAADFNNPAVLVAGAALTTNILGQMKVYLTGLADDKNYRFYRFTFHSTSTPASTLADILMNYYSIEVFPVNKI